MARKKSKELQLAEFLYEYGRQDALLKRCEELWDEQQLVSNRAAHALKQWKETGGRKPSEIDRARTEWEAAGKPPEGIRGMKFKSDGEFDLMATWNANLGRE